MEVALFHSISYNEICSISFLASMKLISSLCIAQLEGVVRSCFKPAELVLLPWLSAIILKIFDF